MVTALYVATPGARDRKGVARSCEIGAPKPRLWTFVAIERRAPFYARKGSS
jgi:hypothetical protein